MALSGDFISGSFATSHYSLGFNWITLLNVTGKGMLNSLMIDLYGTPSPSTIRESLRVTIDGTSRIHRLFDTFDNVNDDIYVNIWAKINLPFSQSLKIEVLQFEGSYNDEGTWRHYYSPYYIKYVKEI